MVQQGPESSVVGGLGEGESSLVAGAHGSEECAKAEVRLGADARVSRAAMTKHPWPGCLTNTPLFLTILEAGVQIKLWTGLVSSEASLLGGQMAASLCPYSVFPP